MLVAVGAITENIRNIRRREDVLMAREAPPTKMCAGKGCSKVDAKDVLEPEFADYKLLQRDCRFDKADDEEFDTYLSKAMKRVCAG